MALAAAAQGRPARASESSPVPGPPTCLAWNPDVAETCPTVEEVETAIREILGRPALAAPSCESRVTGSIRPDGLGGWRVGLHFMSPSGESLGERSLQLRDAPCSALKDSLSLVIALTVEEAGSRGATTALRLPSPPAPPSLATEPRPPIRVLVGAAASSGILPDVGFGASVALASPALAGLPSRLGTTFWFPDSQGTAPGGRFWAWVGSAGVCPSLLRARRFDLSGCFEVFAGAIRGVGLGLDQIEGATRPFGAGEVSAAVSVPISGRMSVYARVGVAVPWVRPRFIYVDQSGTSVVAYQPSAAIPMAGLGVELGSHEHRARSATP